MNLRVLSLEYNGRDTHDSPRIDTPSPDITGLTGIDYGFGRGCNWVKGGSKESVFPNAGVAPLESSAGLGALFG